MWLYCIENARDGDLSGLEDTDLADILEYPGDPAKLRTALVDAKFMTPEGLVVGWQERYAAKLKFYHDRAVTAANARWGRSASASSSPPSRDQKDETRVEENSKQSEACLEHASSTPSPSVWPYKIPEAEIAAIIADTDCGCEVINVAWKIYRQKKVRYHDDFAVERFDGFRDFLRNSVEAKSIKAAFSKAKNTTEECSTEREEPQNWREAAFWKFPTAKFLDPEHMFFAKTFWDLSVQSQALVIQALNEWKSRPE